MLQLRRATVVEADHPASANAPANGASGGAGYTGAAGAEQRLVIELRGGEREGQRRAAVADVGLVGRAQVGDELIVNTQALDLGLGSGGFDVVHVNLTRGLDGHGLAGANVIKLNYTSLQHAVAPVEDGRLELPLARPVAVLALHGQLAAVAWAFAQGAPGMRLGYVQTEGGALPGGHSQTVRELRQRGLLAGHLTAGAAYGGEGEAITTIGALHHGLRRLGWDAAVCGPGPGIVGSSSTLGHGGMAALDSAHVSLALGCPTLLVARMSSGDRRERHRGISHHTLTVLDLLLAPVTVALPAGIRSPVGSDLLAGLGGASGLGARAGARIRQAENRRALTVDVQRPARIARHDWRRAAVDLAAYARSGLPAQTMGRELAQDPLFFGSALAGGVALAELAGAPSGEHGEPQERPSGADERPRVV
jgi:Protein of unknown function (DUF3866)